MPGEAWSAGRTPVTGGALAWRRTGGDGPPLVLAHGQGDSGLCWRRMAEALCDAYDIILLDARGHGDSTPAPAEGFDPAADLEQVLDGLGLSGVAMMGHSVGGRAAAAMAARRPDLVKRLVLEDPVWTPAPAPEAFARLQARYHAYIQDLRAASLDQVLATGRTAHPQWDAAEFPDWARAKQQADPAAVAPATGDWRETAAALRCPTLLIHGEAGLGGLVTPERAAEAAALNRRIRTLRIDNAGHNIRRENFPDTLAAVRAFLIPPAP